MSDHNEMLFTITAIIIFLALLCVIIVVFVIKSRNKIYSKELEKRDLKIKYQNNTLQKVILAQEAERKRIAGDLHDDISSKLIAISLNLQIIKYENIEESKKDNIINNIIAINDKTIESSRQIAHHLYPPVLEKFGLNDALKELVSDFNNTDTINIQLSFEIIFSKEVTNVHLQIFRIIQELINNSIKHGKATLITIIFSKNNCIYSDNGIGFDTSQLEKTMGLGFSNIENRIKNINGTFKLNSAIDEGFKFNFSFKE